MPKQTALLLSNETSCRWPFCETGKAKFMVHPDNLAQNPAISRPIMSHVGFVKDGYAQVFHSQSG